MHGLGRKGWLTVFLLAGVLVCSTPAYAALYQPGATLDPACAPTDANCGVINNVGSGTANQVPYYAGSGTALTATSTLTILPNGHVGVGTTTPGTIFGIGTTGINTISLSNTATSTFGHAIRATCFTTNGTTCITGGSGGSTSPGGSSGQVQFNNGGAFAGASGLTYDSANGRLGVGTSSPYAPLSVAGQVVGAYFTATSTTATSTFGGGVNVGIGNGYFIGGEDVLSVKYGRSVVIGPLNSSNGNSFSTAIGVGNTLPDPRSQFAGYANAVGSLNNASGYGANVFGVYNAASGYFATAFGFNNSAKNNYASAFGISNTATGTNAVAFGYRNTATASESSAFGSNITNTIASSTMIGPSNTAKLTILSTGETQAPYFTATSTTATSTFTGGVNVGSGNGYFDGGWPALAVSTTQVNVGQNTVSSGSHFNNSIALGYFNTVSNGNIGVGNKNTASGGSAVGGSNKASGSGSLAYGLSNTASAYESAAFGYTNNATGYISTAFGHRANATGSFSTAFGYGATASAYNALSVGQNTSVTASSSSAFGSDIINSIATSTMIGPSNTAKLTILSTGETQAPYFTATSTTAMSTFNGGVDIPITATYQQGGKPILSAGFNTAVGTNALGGQTSGLGLNTAVGYEALLRDTSGTNNTGVGSGVLSSNTSGTGNTALGNAALQLNTTGSNNSATGNNALYSNTTGNGNVANGFGALDSNTTGSHNIAIGTHSLYVNTAGSENIASGYSALHNNSASYNIALGYEALYNNSVAASSTAVGALAGYTNVTGSHDLFLGDSADASVGTLTNATAIGSHAIVGKSNSIVLGGTGSYAANVGIGTTSPYAKLAVVGNIVASTTATSTFTGGVDVGAGHSYSINGGRALYGYYEPAYSFYQLSTGFKNAIAGSGSIAIGVSNVATNTSAIAVGAGNKSTGLTSIALGVQNNLTGIWGTAAGYQNTVNAIGGNAFGRQNTITISGSSGGAFGYNNTIAAASAYAFGASIKNAIPNSVQIGPSNTAKLTILSTGETQAPYFTATSTTATSTFNGGVDIATTTAYSIGGNNVLALSGIENVAIGPYNTVSGSYLAHGARPVLAIGDSNIATTSEASAIGLYNSVTGNASAASAVGYYNQVTNANSSAFGSTNVISGSYGGAFGYGNTVGGVWGTAVGYQNTTTGPNFPTAIGSSNNTSGSYATALGYANTAAGNDSTSIGYNNTTGATNASAFGSSITNNIANSVQIGPSNTAKLTILSTGETQAPYFTATSTTATSTFTGGVFVGANTAHSTEIDSGGINIGGHAGYSRYTAYSIGGSQVLGSNASGLNVGMNTLSAFGGGTAVGLSNTLSSTYYGSAVGYHNNVSGGTESGAFGSSNTVSASVGTAYAFGYGITNSVSNSVMLGPSNTAKLTILSTGETKAPFFTATSTTATSTFTGGVNVGAGNGYFINGNPILSYAQNTQLDVGFNNTVAGIAGDTVVGISNNVTGTNAAVFGGSNVVSGTTAAVVGSSNEVSANSDGALGISNIVSAGNAYAFGSNLKNSITNSVQIGPSNTAKLTILSTGETQAPYFTATSTTATSTFNGDVTLSKAKGLYLGTTRVLYENNNGGVALGYNSTVGSGVYASSVGYQNTASGFGALAYGGSNNVTGSLGSAFGYGNTVNVASASAFGTSITNTIASSVQIGPSNTAKVTILSSGNVGIGTTTPYSRLTVWGPDSAAGTAALTVANTASTTLFQVYDDGNATLAGTLTQNSDRRLKTDINALDASTTLALLNELKPVTFHWRDRANASDTQVGFIAQDVQKVFPELVATTAPTKLTPHGTLGVNYIGLVSPLVEGVKALYGEVTSLSEKVAGFAHELITQKVQTKELCVGTTCINQNQLAQILKNQTGGAGASQTTTPTSHQPLSVSLVGPSTMQLSIGSTYVEQGATVSGGSNASSTTYQIYVNGSTTATSSPWINTGTAGTYRLTYAATDSAGENAKTVRTVIVGARTDGTAGAGDSSTSSPATTTPTQSNASSTPPVQPQATTTPATSNASSTPQSNQHATSTDSGTSATLAKTLSSGAASSTQQVGGEGSTGASSTPKQ